MDLVLDQVNLNQKPRIQSLPARFVRLQEVLLRY